MEIIKINVGGKLFETSKTTITKYPETLLARIINTQVPVARVDGYIWIDRNGDLFSYILDFYRNNVISYPSNVSQKDFHRELDFWLIPHPEDQPQISIDHPLLGLLLKTNFENDQYLCLLFIDLLIGVKKALKAGFRKATVCYEYIKISHSKESLTNLINLIIEVPKIKVTTHKIILKW